MYKLARIAMLLLVMKELEMPRITEHIDMPKAMELQFVN